MRERCALNIKFDFWCNKRTTLFESNVSCWKKLKIHFINMLNSTVWILFFHGCSELDNWVKGGGGGVLFIYSCSHTINQSIQKKLIVPSTNM